MKRNIIRQLNKKAGITSLKQASKIYDLVIDGILRELKQNGKIYIKGLGIIKIVEKKNRVIVFNALNKKYLYPVYHRIKFIPSGRLKKWLKNKQLEH